MTLTIVKSKGTREKQRRETIMLRTRNLHHAHEQSLCKDAYAPRWREELTPKQRRDKPLDRYIMEIARCNRLLLPYTLEALRAMVVSALGALDVCPYCGEQLSVKNFSIEHKIPTSRRVEFKAILSQVSLIPATLFSNANAPDERLETAHDEFERDDWILLLQAYSLSNTTLCCVACNRRKGDLTVDEWRTLMTAVEQMSTTGRRYVMTKLASVPFRFWQRKGKANEPCEA